MLTREKSGVISDQYDYWSDSVSQSIDPISPEPATSSCTTAAAAARHHSRFADRALQTLRKTRLQMRPGTGPRAQVLPLDQSSRSHTRDGLCPSRRPRNRRAVPGEFSPRPRYPGSNLLYQPRVVASQGALVEKLDVPSKPTNLRCNDRSPPGGYSGRQHGRSIVARKVASESCCGDEG